MVHNSGHQLHLDGVGRRGHAPEELQGAARGACARRKLRAGRARNRSVQDQRHQALQLAHPRLGAARGWRCPGRRPGAAPRGAEQLANGAEEALVQSRK